MRRPLRAYPPRAFAAVASAAILSVTLVTAAPASADDRPAAAVSLGDSAASGEGARSYETGTDQTGVNQCHRSTVSYIHQTNVAGIDETINLACSGADSANLMTGGPGQWNETSQADQLATAAATHNVELITLQIGANDEPGFADTVLECVIRWAVIFGPGCRDTVGAEWPARVEAMQPKAVAAVQDVRQVMASAGYTDADYDLIIVSYASPVTENVQFGHALAGCPIRKADAQWGRTVATTLLSDALADVAAQTGARYLDLSRATEGHEACNRNVPSSQEWVRPLTVRVEQVLYGIGGHLVQESFHPNARGHDQMGRCLGEFASGGAPSATCLKGGDGNLHPTG
jgi:lysophospholipase L1-like esterase